MRENLAGNSCGKILRENLAENFLRENLAGNSCRKILQEISCRKLLQENLAGNSCGKILREIDAENFLRENLVGNSCGKNLAGNSCGKNLAGNCCLKFLAGKSCGKLLREIVAGQEGGARRRGKSQFKKGSDWWKFGIWNRVIGSQPIRMQLRKNLAGNFLREIIAGKSCGKILREILVGNSCRTRRRGNSQFKKGNDWWKFSIWNRVMGSQPIRMQLRKILREIVAGKSCGKFLREIVAGQGGREKANLRKAVIGGNLAFGIG